MTGKMSYMSRVTDARHMAHDHEGTRPHDAAPPDGEASTDLVAQVHDRIAPIHDHLYALLELMGGRARRMRTIRGATGDVLDIGIGTGLNLGLYAPTVRLTAIDVSERMLERARARAARLHRSVHLWLGNVERLPFASESFDTVVGTYVFCSVENPVRGLQDVWRVLRPGGQLRLLEPVRPRHALFAAMADTVSPLSRRLFGSSLICDIEAHLALVGFETLRVRGTGLWREIVARRHSDSSEGPAIS